MKSVVIIFFVGKSSLFACHLIGKTKSWKVNFTMKWKTIFCCIYKKNWNR